MNWPNDADGDVFRSLEKQEYDFDAEYKIDINLDFDHWPLAKEELVRIQSLYPNVEIVEPESGEDIGNGKDVGFLQFQIISKLSYENITSLQEKVTKQISEIGGFCNSWGVGQW